MLWWLRAQLNHLYSVFRRNKTDFEIDEELLYHLEMRAKENIEGGMSPDEARRAAVKRFGSVLRVKEDSREIRRGTTLDSIWQDLRYSTRMMLKQPAFALVVIFTIMIGIGSNTAIFSVVNSILLKPLPYDRPSELTMVWADYRKMNVRRFPTSGTLMGELRDRSKLLQSVGGIWATSGTFTDGDEAEQVRNGWVTENFFSVLGVRPALGRAFVQGDGDNDAVIIISHSLWQRRFGNDPNIIGKHVRFNSTNVRIVGVLPADFVLAFPPDANVPMTIEAWTPIWDGVYRKRGIEYMRMFARMKPGVSIEQAQSEADSIAEQVRKDDGYFQNAGLELEVIPLHRDVVKDIRPPLLALFIGAGVVLLISCFNVTNLLLSRANSRRKEIAVRTAMGASKWRVARQLLAESLGICLIGGVLGLFAGWIGLKLLLLIRPESLVRVGSIGLDWTTLGYVTGITLFSGLLASLAPMLDVRKVDLAVTLKEEGRSSSGHKQNRIRNLLIVSEIALGFVILIGAGLMGRTLQQLHRVGPGFDPNHTLTFQISFDVGYDSVPEKTNFETQWEQRLAAIPGVKSVGSVSHLPLDDYPNWYNWYQPEGTSEEAAKGLIADLRSASPGYFRTIGARLIAGRYFDEQDTSTSRDVAIIDQTLAEQAWPGQSAIGKKIRAQHYNDGEFVHQWTEVVGVVEHIKVHDILRPVRSQIYMPFNQCARWHNSYVVRSDGNLASLVPMIREELAKIDKNLAMAKVRPMNDYVAKAMAPTNFTVVLAGIFAGFALLLAVIGIYGVISYSVSQRTHEIGIRMAIGAAPSDILRLVIREGLRLTFFGLIIGVAGAYLLTGYLQNMLFGVTPTDPMTFVVIALLVPLAAVMACWQPARKAAAGSPMDVLRKQV